MCARKKWWGKNEQIRTLSIGTEIRPESFFISYVLARIFQNKFQFIGLIHSFIHSVIFGTKTTVTFGWNFMQSAKHIFHSNKKKNTTNSKLIYRNHIETWDLEKESRKQRNKKSFHLKTRWTLNETHWLMVNIKNLPTIDFQYTVYQPHRIR